MRVILDDIEPILNRVLADVTIASWMAGAKQVVDRLPPLPPPELELTTTPAPPPFLAEELPPQTIFHWPSQESALPPPVPPPPPTFFEPYAPEPLIKFPIIEEAAADLAQRQLMFPHQFYALDAEAKMAAFTVSNVSSLDTLGRIQQALVETVEESLSLRTFAEKLDAAVDVSGLGAAHLENVFRTNVMTAYQRGYDAVVEHPLVVDEFPYDWAEGIEDSRQTDLCYAVNNGGINGTHVFRRDDPTWRRLKPTRHFNCFLPGTVAQGRFNGGAQIAYSGEAVEILTRRGYRLACTINHPILSNKGFTAAGSLQERDKIFCYGETVKDWLSPDRFDLAQRIPRSENPRFLAPDKNEDYGPARVEDIFETLADLYGVVGNTPTAPDDFYGDSATSDGEVQVVGAYWQLMLHLEFVRTHGVSDFTLATMDKAKSLVSRLGSPHHGLGTVDATTISSPSSTALFLRGSPIHFRPLEFFLFGLRPNRNRALNELPSQDSPANASLLLKFEERFACQIFLDEIVELRRFDYDGHVYDFQSDVGLIVANRIFTSNCRCARRPVTIREAAELGIEEAVEWQATGVPPAQPTFVEWPRDLDGALVTLPQGWER